MNETRSHLKGYKIVFFFLLKLIPTDRVIEVQWITGIAISFFVFVLIVV